jgi:hypothetical protein
MAKTKLVKIKVASAKKQTYEQVVKQLAEALPGLKDLLGEKKFEKRIKKAAKLLSAGVKPKKVKAKIDIPVQKEA